MNASKEKVIGKLRASKNVSIYIHINVDCDAMSSALALREVLLGMGKNVDVYVNSEFPNNFKFYGDLSFVNKRQVTDKYDLVICLDSANEARIGKYKYTYKKPTKNTLLIDHHDLVSTYFCNTNYVIHSSSTAEILYDIFKEMNVELSARLCKILLAGIITDTGKFTYAATSSTFRVVSELLEIGDFAIEEVTQPLLNSMKMEVFNLMKLAYEKMEFYCEGKLAIVMFHREDFLNTGTGMEDVDVFPDIPLQLECVKFAILASEDDQGYFRVSFRSKGDLSAKDVATCFGGGGHQNASGCKIFGEFDEVKEKLISATTETLGWNR